jgi:hypothetical protein
MATRLKRLKNLYGIEKQPLTDVEVKIARCIVTELKKRSKKCGFYGIRMARERDLVVRSNS